MKGMLSGVVVNLATTAVAAHQAHKETGNALVSLNAVSHWLWGDHAVYRQAPSTKYTLTGFIIHHLASFLWAAIYERFFDRDAEHRRLGRAYAGAVAVAVASYMGDYYIAPRRLSPGWDLRLSRPALWAIYSAIALTLPLRGLAWRARRPPLTAISTLAWRPSGRKSQQRQ